MSKTQLERLLTAEDLHPRWHWAVGLPEAVFYALRLMDIETEVDALALTTEQVSLASDFDPSSLAQFRAWRQARIDRLRAIAYSIADPAK